MIMNRTESGYVIENEYGKTFELTCSEASDLRFLLMQELLRGLIEMYVEDYDGSVIALGSYDGLLEEFVEEVFDRIGDELTLDCILPTDDYIQETILSVADEYGIRIPDDE